MLTYSGVTPEKLETLKAVLEKHGFVIEGDSGEIKKMGADVTASYDPAAQTLAVDVKKTPWMIGRERFTKMLNGEIEAHL